MSDEAFKSDDLKRELPDGAGVSEWKLWQLCENIEGVSGSEQRKASLAALCEGLSEADRARLLERVDDKDAGAQEALPAALRLAVRENTAVKKQSLWQWLSNPRHLVPASALLAAAAALLVVMRTPGPADEPGKRIAEQAQAPTAGSASPRSASDGHTLERPGSVRLKGGGHQLEAIVLRNGEEIGGFMPLSSLNPQKGDLVQLRVRAPGTRFIKVEGEDKGAFKTYYEGLIPANRVLPFAMEITDLEASRIRYSICRDVEQKQCSQHEAHIGH